MTRGGQIRSMRGGMAASTASSRAIASSAPSNSIGGTAISDLALSSQGEPPRLRVHLRLCVFRE
jgi:hypothetical protein